MVTLRGYATAREANETYQEIKEAYTAAEDLDQLELVRNEYEECIDSFDERDEITSEQYGFSYRESLETLYAEKEAQLKMYPKLERI